MSLALEIASRHAFQARKLSSPSSAVTAAAGCRAPTTLVAAPPRALAPALHVSSQNLYSRDIRQRRQQRAALLQCTAEASSSSGGDARQPQQEQAASAALVLSSSDDERNPSPSASTIGGGDISAATGIAIDGGSDSGSESSGSESSAGDDGAVRIDLQLPRRSLLVQFTCNVCGGRSERLCNPIAWQKGLVIAQCQHCPSWHKLADAANLVEEIRYADLESE
ncbi:hypothetical protein ABPG77_009913 [Micractinium sp. CCAP 211/92]